MWIGICDDQEESRLLIADKVKMVYKAADIIFYSSGQEVLESPQLPDILLLDIQMPGINGIETAISLRKFNKHVIIIFITITEDYVFQSFDVCAFHYLVKPFSDTKFKEILQNAIKQYKSSKIIQSLIKQTQQCIMVNSNGRHITIKLDDIIYAEVFNRKVIIHTIDSDIEYYGKMKDLAQKAGSGFYRTHRAYLVNFDFIQKYDAKTIYLTKGEALMSKQNYHDFTICYLRHNQRKGNRQNGI